MNEQEDPLRSWLGADCFIKRLHREVNCQIESTIKTKRDKLQCEKLKDTFGVLTIKDEDEIVEYSPR